MIISSGLDNSQKDGRLWVAYIQITVVAICPHQSPNLISILTGSAIRHNGVSFWAASTPKLRRRQYARINTQILQRLPSAYAMKILTALTIARNGGPVGLVSDAHVAVADICPHQRPDREATAATALYLGNDNTNWL